MKISISVGHLNSPSSVCLKVLLYNKHYFIFDVWRDQNLYLYIPNQTLYLYLSPIYWSRVSIIHRCQGIALTYKRSSPDMGASMVAQTVKNPPVMRETWIQSLGWEGPLEKGMATHSSILAWRIPMDRGACGLQSIVSQSRTRLQDWAQALMWKLPPHSRLSMSSVHWDLVSFTKTIYLYQWAQEEVPNPHLPFSHPSEWNHYNLCLESTDTFHVALHLCYVILTPEVPEFQFTPHLLDLIPTHVNTFLNLSLPISFLILL